MSCAALRCAVLCCATLGFAAFRCALLWHTRVDEHAVVTPLYSRVLAVNILSVGVTSDSILCLDYIVCVYCCGLSAATLMGGFDGHLEPAAEVAKGQGIMSSVYYWSYVVIVVVLFLENGF